MLHGKKISWSIINVLASFMAVILSLVALIRSQKPVIATVDISHIISRASHAMAKSYPNGNVPKAVLNRLIQHIKQTTEDFGHDNNALIIAKQALLSGESHDLTEKIAMKLSQENVFKWGLRDGE